MTTQRGSHPVKALPLPSAKVAIPEQKLFIPLLTPAALIAYKIHLLESLRAEIIARQPASSSQLDTALNLACDLCAEETQETFLSKVQSTILPIVKEQNLKKSFLQQFNPYTTEHLRIESSLQIHSQNADAKAGYNNTKAHNTLGKLYSVLNALDHTATEAKAASASSKDLLSPSKKRKHEDDNEKKVTPSDDEENEQVKKFKTEIAKLEAEKAQLEAKSAKLETEKAQLKEQLARSEGAQQALTNQLIAANQTVVQVAQQSRTSTPAPLPSTPVPQPPTHVTPFEFKIPHYKASWDTFPGKYFSPASLAVIKYLKDHTKDSKIGETCKTICRKLILNCAPPLDKGYKKDDYFKTTQEVIGAVEVKDEGLNAAIKKLLSDNRDDFTKLTQDKNAQYNIGRIAHNFHLLIQQGNLDIDGMIGIESTGTLFSEILQGRITPQWLAELRKQQEKIQATRIEQEQQRYGSTSRNSGVSSVMPMPPTPTGRQSTAISGFQTPSFSAMLPPMPRPPSRGVTPSSAFNQFSGSSSSFGTGTALTTAGFFKPEAHRSTTTVHSTSIATDANSHLNNSTSTMRQ